jgi:hypothetical protein
MQETTVKCDFCRNSIPESEPSIEVRIDDTLHDLCKGCSDKLSKLIRGTGRPVPESAQPPVDWTKLLGGQPIEITPAIGITPAVPYSPPQPSPWGNPSTGVWMSNVPNYQGGQMSGNMTITNTSGESWTEPTAGLDPEGLNSQMALLNSIFFPSAPYVGKPDTV